MIYEQQDYRRFLKTVFAEKSAMRKSYSLRAFAEKLNISTSFLSEILNSKKDLSVDLAFKIAFRLDLTDAETRYFCMLVQLEQETDPQFREELTKRLQALNPKQNVQDLSVDIFKTIADWYHLAILELTYLAHFSFTPSNIAQALGISKMEAEVAVDRLRRLELLKKGKNDKYFKSQDNLLAESQVHNSAFKMLHKQVLEKSISALETQSPKERISATDVLAIDSKYVPEVNRLSEEFSLAVLKLGEKSKIKNKVYILSTHFFDATNFEEKKT